MPNPKRTYHGTMHVIAQSGNHDPAFIVGTVDALTALRGAIDTAITSFHGIVHTFAADGEGYSIAVIMETDGGMADVPSGYTDPECADDRVWTRGMRRAIDDA